MLRRQIDELQVYAQGPEPYPSREIKDPKPTLGTQEDEGGGDGKGEPKPIPP